MTRTDVYIYLWAYIVMGCLCPLLWPVWVVWTLVPLAGTLVTWAALAAYDPDLWS